MDNAGRARQRGLAAFLPITAVLYVSAEALDPTTRSTAPRQIPRGVVTERSPGSDRLLGALPDAAWLPGTKGMASRRIWSHRTERHELAWSPARINRLIDDALRDPAAGIGKPEPLRHMLAGAWSRRISEEHRLV